MLHYHQMSGICKTQNKELQNNGIIKQLSLITVFHYKGLYYIALQVSNGIFLSLNATMHT